MPPQSAAVRPATSCCLLIAVFKPTFCSRLAVSPHGPPSIPPPPTHPSLFPLQDFDTWMAWDTNPLYALLHESIYCQGAASNWAAHRIRWALCRSGCASALAARLCTHACHGSSPKMFGQLIHCPPHLCMPGSPGFREAEFGQEFDAVAAASSGQPVMFTGGWLAPPCAAACSPQSYAGDAMHGHWLGQAPPQLPALH